MDRQTSINNVNQRYISNAIASGLAPSLNFPGGYPSGFNNDINIPPLTADTDLNAAEGVPISISAAQRSISPYGGLTDRAGHNSRVGQVMYDQGAGIPQRVKSRLQGLNQTRQAPGWIALLLPTILCLLLLIFVITCIVKHRNTPFSQNSLRYYNQHPDVTSALASSDSSFTKALVNQQIHPTVHPSINQSNDFSQQIDHQPNQVVSNQGVLQQQLQNVQNNQQLTPVSQYTGECKQGQYLLNGICYPCRNGFWDGKRCVTKGLGSSLIANQTVQQTQTTLTSLNTLNPASTLSAYNPLGSNLQCKDGRTPVNGQCIDCPSDSIWNGNSCQRIGEHYHHARVLHLRRKQL